MVLVWHLQLYVSQEPAVAVSVVTVSSVSIIPVPFKLRG